MSEIWIPACGRMRAMRQGERSAKETVAAVELARSLGAGEVKIMSISQKPSLVDV